MTSAKRYYWLKLDENFFNDDTIAWLEEQENGKDYIIFYLKLCLSSLKDDGSLIRYVGDKLIPYEVKSLAKLTNTSPDTVAVAIKTFREYGLIDIAETGEIFMSQINEMIGSETENAKRVRKHRAKKALEGKSYKALHCNAEVTKCNTEKELEIEKELEKDIDTLPDSNESAGTSKIPYKEVVDYLNQSTNKKYRSSTKKTKSLIKARFNEGFNLDDFRTVIDKKTREWLDDSNMNQYLRPETLFGTKFESYLNQADKVSKDRGPRPDWLDDTEEQPVIEVDNITKDSIEDRLDKLMGGS